MAFPSLAEISAPGALPRGRRAAFRGMPGPVLRSGGDWQSAMHDAPCIFFPRSPPARLSLRGDRVYRAGDEHADGQEEHLCPHPAGLPADAPEALSPAFKRKRPEALSTAGRAGSGRGGWRQPRRSRRSSRSVWQIGRSGPIPLYIHPQTAGVRQSRRERCAGPCCTPPRGRRRDACTPQPRDGVWSLRCTGPARPGRSLWAPRSSRSAAGGELSRRSAARRSLPTRPTAGAHRTSLPPRPSRMHPPVLRERRRRT